MSDRKCPVWLLISTISPFLITSSPAVSTLGSFPPMSVGCGRAFSVLVPRIKLPPLIDGKNVVAIVVWPRRACPWKEERSVLSKFDLAKTAGRFVFLVFEGDTAIRISLFNYHSRVDFFLHAPGWTFVLWVKLRSDGP